MPTYDSNGARTLQDGSMLRARVIESERGEMLETAEAREPEVETVEGDSGLGGRDSRQKLFFSKLLFLKELVAGRQGFVPIRNER